MLWGNIVLCILNVPNSLAHNFVVCCPSPLFFLSFTAFLYSWKVSVARACPPPPGLSIIMKIIEGWHDKGGRGIIEHRRDPTLSSSMMMMMMMMMIILLLHCVRIAAFGSLASHLLFFFQMHVVLASIRLFFPGNYFLAFFAFSF